MELTGYWHGLPKSHNCVLFFSGFISFLLDVDSLANFFFEVYFYFMRMGVLLACMSMYNMCARCPQKPEEGVTPSGTGVPDCH